MGAGGFEADFGRTARDYARHRPGFPPSFFRRMEAQGLVGPGLRTLDLGTGTGALARALARRGLEVTGLDISRELLAEAVAADRAAGVHVTHVVARAEDTGLAAGGFDLVTAGQCWHWFDGPAAAREAGRLLRAGGALLVAHYDWLPLPGSVAAVTEALIGDWNPRWTMGGGDGLYPQWAEHLRDGGFEGIESVSMDVVQTFDHEAWRGRIRASAGVGGSLGEDVVRRFDADLAEVLRAQFPEEVLEVPHRVFAIWGRRGE